MPSLRRLAATIFAASLSLTLTGCGAGELAGPAVIPMAGIAGSVYGGGIPIYNGRVRLYLTNTTATGATYGSTTAATEVTQSPAVYTDAYGAFSINAGYTCTTGQFAYITVTGGDAGGGTLYGGVYTANNNSVQMAALGSCASVGSPTAGTGSGNNSTVRVYVSELSTVAAAYALSNFISEDPAHLGDGDERVWVNAPPANNASTGSCTVVSNATTGCTAAGLAHAFDNARNLVNYVNYSSTLPSGVANYTLGGPSATTIGTISAGTNANATVPQALLNTIADIDEACVNTNGGSATSGTANDGSACGQLFSYTTYSANTPPADTLAALVSLAHHPSGYLGTSVANLFALMPKVGAGFTPYLAASPTDFSVMIVYNGYTGYTLNSVNDAALDSAGNVYFDDNDSAKANLLLYSLSPNGTQRWAATIPTVGVHANASIAGMVATDTLGASGTSRVWIQDSANVTANRLIYCYTAAGAACTSSPAAGYVTQSTFGGVMAFDKANNLWTGRSPLMTTYSLYEFLQSTYTESTHGTYNTGQITSSIAIDQGQNVWFSGKGGSGTAAQYAYLATGGATPVGAALPNTSGGTVVQGVAGVAVDASQHIYYAGAGTLATVSPSVNGSNVVTSANTPVSNTAAGTTTGFTMVDGSGVVWYGGGTGTASPLEGANSSGAVQVLSPCQLASQGTTCAPMLKSPASISIDDTGSMWVAYGLASFTGMGQVIGTASPAWPQLSLTNPGVCPGNTTVYSFGCK